MAGPPPIPSKTRPSFTNPFYRNSNASSSSTASSPPPSYGTHSSHSTQPPRPSSTQQFEPVQYSSLSSLTKNQPKHTHTSQPASYEYQPDPSRQGYSTRGFESQGQAVNENVNAGRRLPPMPGQGQSRTGTPTEPPQRAIHSASAPPPPPPRTGSGFQSYIPSGAQSGFDSAAKGVRGATDTMKDGFYSMASQQRKEQVMSGIGKLGVGAVKLAGKGVYQVGKFATK
ncbi:hypothetical protein C347_04846 [Cryptococcus neoformans AD2-60a]|uniref:Uncharacterized protein n=1 Tax=Cryptococcus neoformans Tu259-1 TaxID=1230072 RepID=A0A854Q7M1_CRYNE|nr:hypothetical protein C347_04846 [Cryptococcus neoformans var. grubii AD2-60a]OWZ37260.1 hypothetical protein C353_04699 [Cryptococcus neoformans var. grubii AD1-83a]OWZ52642.1 hypothetical protein C368_04872 [Cryptococcus neoformans var. grubii 125.91]OXC83378.1 hypothetical protein C344_04524 [Cryptococcus neoformans var. grubii AD1-7a]OXG16641.1 hypothetical protein C361_05012 [Cryptococcus neoformans var. grubii Tu259-1]OXG35960.1 hypothetical protein C360_02562 [Cryptococcus neoformans 